VLIQFSLFPFVGFYEYTKCQHLSEGAQDRNPIALNHAPKERFAR